MRYQLAIREAYVKLEATHYHAPLSKQTPEFRKAWSAKFKKNACSDILFKDCCNDADVANMSADIFFHPSFTILMQTETEGQARPDVGSAAL